MTVVLLTCVQDGMATVADGNGGIFTRLASRKVRRPAREEYRAWRCELHINTNLRPMTAGQSWVWAWIVDHMDVAEVMDEKA